MRSSIPPVVAPGSSGCGRRSQSFARRDGSRMSQPRMYSVQSTGCAPMVRAVLQGADRRHAVGQSLDCRQRPSGTGTTWGSPDAERAARERWRGRRGNRRRPPGRGHAERSGGGNRFLPGGRSRTGGGAHSSRAGTCSGRPSELSCSILGPAGSIARRRNCPRLSTRGDISTR